MTRRIVLAATLSTLLCTAADIDPKGIFISSATTPPPAGVAPNHPAVRWGIELNRGGDVRQVPANYRFQSGDRFRFVFELNQPAYVYVVNRSLEGNPEAMGALLGTRGINVVDSAVQANQQAAAPKLQMLWPAGSGTARLDARRPQSVPGPTQYFEFDNTPGIEKISMLISPSPLNPSANFPGLPAPPHPAAARNDTNEDVVARLRDLGSIDSNTATDPGAGASRGICVGDCSGYSAPRRPDQPFIVTLDLRHYQ